jgi:hypothetical protein
LVKNVMQAGVQGESANSKTVRSGDSR